MRDVKKGTRYRKWLYNRLLWLSQTVFDTEEEEYQAIQKFPRGMWCKYDTTFKTKKEEKFMIRAQIPLTNLDQHDGTTGPSLKPDWSFSASPATFTIFFFFFY